VSTFGTASSFELVGRFELAGAGDAISVSEPQFQGLLKDLTDLLLLGWSCAVIQNHLPLNRNRCGPKEH